MFTSNSSGRCIRAFSAIAVLSMSVALSRTAVSFPEPLLAEHSHMKHLDLTSHSIAIPQLVRHSLERAGTNRSQLLLAWQKIPVKERAGMAFLLENMPDDDLKTLSSAYLIENVAVAYHAMASAPWASSVPPDIFLNNVLPYASLDENRDNSRALLRAKSLPLIAGITSLGAAAQAINSKLFPLIKVKYSTERERPNQNPTETMKSGLASCSGLSILLVDACRSVGIPARIAGTPLWMNMRGNHTWVEIWDGTTWRFLGAAEPDSQGLDHAWFVADASEAREDMPAHAIYASSFKKTGLSFPLVWAEGSTSVPAVNVTDRYASRTAADPANQSRLLIRVVDMNGKRVETHVTIQEDGSTQKQSGLSKGEQADTNNFLNINVPRSTHPARYTAILTSGGKAVHTVFIAGTEPEEVIEIRTDGHVISQPSLRLLFANRFGSDSARADASAKILAGIPLNQMSREFAWGAYKTSPVGQSLRADLDAKIVRTPDRTSPYLWRTVGEKPPTGWALVIAMHGGGGAPKEVNDGEWKYMFSTYYKDHPEAGGYIYLALRAPNDTWNGFYDDAISPLIEQLIKQFVLLEDVDPDKVYTLGASHGGYGAFVIGPKIPYRFAAVHAAASAPTDGETYGENLRDVPFSIMTGALDDGYGRIDRDQKFMAEVEGWRKLYGGYDITLTSPAGVGHLVPDHDVLADMLKYRRNPWPSHIVWSQSDTVLHRFYWLDAPRPNPKGHIEAIVSGNTIVINSLNQDKVSLWLDQSLVNLNKPVTVKVAGFKDQKFVLHPNAETFCEGIMETADPRLAAPVKVEVNLQ